MFRAGRPTGAPGSALLTTGLRCRDRMPRNSCDERRPPRSDRSLHEVIRSWHFFFNQLENLPEQLTAGHEREYLTWWFRSKALRPDCFTNQEIEAYCHEYSKPNRLTQGWAYYRAIPRTAEINRQFATKPLAMPVLAIGGSNSAGLNLARAITQSTPGVVGEVIAESGHFVPEEQPERTLAVLLGALSAANL
jgi:pimeloyl-ACP methyl ester carboxylesterase